MDQGHTELVGRNQSAFPLWQESVLFEPLCSGAADLPESCGFTGLFPSLLLNCFNRYPDYIPTFLLLRLPISPFSSSYVLLFLLFVPFFISFYPKL